MSVTVKTTTVLDVGATNGSVSVEIAPGCVSFRVSTKSVGQTLPPSVAIAISHEDARSLCNAIQRALGPDPIPREFNDR